MANIYPEIFVLRHGQTEWNVAGRFQGRMNSELTAKGRAQAGMQGELLAEVAKGRNDIAAHCSPQKRAMHTAQIALDPLGMVAAQDERLCEISFGAWEGLNFEQISTGWSAQVKNFDRDGFDWQFQSPNGETFDVMQARIKAFLETLTGPSIIVTHGITSRILRGVWLGYAGNEIASLGGGQGCVYHLRDGQQVMLQG